MLKMKQAIIAALPIAPIRSAINTGGMGIQGSFDECPRSPMSRPKKSPSGNNRSATSVQSIVTRLLVLFRANSGRFAPSPSTFEYTLSLIETLLMLLLPFDRVRTGLPLKVDL
jgi:hypothetical protein